MLDQYKDPKYTGANRCLPCTLGNLAITVIISAAVAAISVIGGAIAFLGATTAIYFKGYLIPGTPTLTKQYFPRWLLKIFGKEPTAADGLASGGTSDAETIVGPGQSSDGGIELEQFLITHNLVEATTDGDDLQLTSAFSEDWYAEMETLYGDNLSSRHVAAALQVDASSDTELYEQDGAYSLTTDESSIGRWPSRAALVADMAAARLLTTRVETWEKFSTHHRGVILNGLRIFLQRCPGQGGAITLREETVESCCTSQQVIAATCDESGERILEQPV